MRYLVVVFLLLFAVGAFAAGLVPLPWAISPKKAPDPQRAEQSQPNQKSAARSETKAANTTAAQAPDAKSSDDAPKTVNKLNASQPAAGSTAEKQKLAANSKPATSRKFGIDVARIDPQGSSVIAGLFEPSSRVAVLANGTVIGTTVTDEQGNWVLVTSHQFANSDPKLTLQRADEKPTEAPTKPPTSAKGGTKKTQTQISQSSGAAKEPVPQKRTEEPKQRTAAISEPRKRVDEGGRVTPQPRRTADDVAGEMMQKLRRLTREAEKDNATQAAAKSEAKTAMLQTAERQSKATAANEKKQLEQQVAKAQTTGAEAATPRTATPDTSKQAPVNSNSSETTSAKTKAGQPTTTNSGRPNSEVAKSGAIEPDRSQTEVAEKIIAISPPGVARTPESAPQAKPAQPVVASLSQTKVSFLGRKNPTKRSASGSSKQAATPQPLSVVDPSAGSAVIPAVRTSTVASITPKTVATISASKQPARQTERLPVPVQFIFRKSAFTEQGREAAELLLAYLKAKNFKAVTLSGHADERGSPTANRKLSRQRLNQLEKFLRDGGFEGDLTLLPKGESEQYTGVDRSRFPLEELYQLDRRVEVVATR